MNVNTENWNIVASDLQRAANNVAWFVLESMMVMPEQPPFWPAQPVSLTTPLVPLKNIMQPAPLPTSPLPASSKTVDNSSALAKKHKRKADLIYKTTPDNGQKRCRHRRQKLNSSSSAAVKSKDQVGYAVDQLVADTLNN